MTIQEDRERFAQEIRAESVALCDRLDNMKITYGMNMYKEIIQYIKERG